MADDRRRVDVGGYQLAYEVAGSGSPAVVLEAGIGGTSDAWDSIFAHLARFTRVCRYDRAGLGGSDAAETPRSCMAAVTDLHTSSSPAPLADEPLTAPAGMRHRLVACLRTANGIAEQEPAILTVRFHYKK